MITIHRISNSCPVPLDSFGKSLEKAVVEIYVVIILFSDNSDGRVGSMEDAFEFDGFFGSPRISGSGVENNTIFLAAKADVEKGIWAFQDVHGRVVGFDRRVRGAIEGNTTEGDRSSLGKGILQKTLDLVDVKNELLRRHAERGRAKNFVVLSRVSRTVMIKANCRGD